MSRTTDASLGRIVVALEAIAADLAGREDVHTIERKKCPNEDCDQGWIRSHRPCAGQMCKVCLGQGAVEVHTITGWARRRKP